jgi:hypothetical protein
MEPPLTADAASLITWSLNSYRKTCFFTSRLGLPQPESNKNQRGWTSFEGDLAPSCRALYDSLRDIRKVLLSRLKTKQGVRVAGDTLIAEVTEPLLAEHGATIWSDSPPFSTVIDIWNYPKYLKHNNSSDRERLVTPDITNSWVLTRCLGSCYTSTAGLSVKCSGAQGTLRAVDAKSIRALLG